MNKVIVYFGLCLLFASVVSGALIIQEPSFADEFAFDTSPALSWDGCSADSYFVQIATDGLFDSMIFQNTVLTSSYDLEFDLDPGRYFFRVNSIATDGSFSCTSPTVEFEVKELLPLSFIFDTSSYKDDSLVKVTVNGPLDAKVTVDITSTDGFNLPIVLEDLSSPEFEVILTPSFYTFDAFSQYADGELKVKQTMALEVPQPTSDSPSQSTTTSTVDDGKYNLGVEVTLFEGDPIDDAQVTIIGPITNYTVDLNASGMASIRLDEDEYEVIFRKDGYSSKERELVLDEEKSVKFIVVETNSTFEEEESIEVEDIQTVVPTVSLNDFDQSAYASSYVPIIFTLDGETSRCQVLTKNSAVESYVIAESVLNPSALNEVVLSKLVQGDYDVRIRCILSSSKAIISKTKSISIINIDKDISELEESISDSQKVIDRINGFPTSFKQVFIDEIIVLEGYLSSTKELLKQAKSSTDLLETRRKISELKDTSELELLDNIVVEDSQSTIAYADIDEVGLVKKYLDLSKSEKKLLEDQELFAIKTNYNFVSLTYTSGLTLKQTFVSSQVIPVEGTDTSIAFDEYFVMPSFLTSRLSATNDMLVKAYDDRSLVRLLENSSALIFDGWVDDTSLIKTIVLTDGASLSSSPTGFLINDISLPEWKIPLISFIIIIIIAGLFFNPYYSVLDIFEKDHVGSFTTKVNECIDASISAEHDKVIQLVPKILDIHEKLSAQDKLLAQDIIDNVREVFYEATYNLTLKKISSKAAHLWTYNELEIAIKDFYGSYAKLAPVKQNAYRPYFNKMLDYCQHLLSEVKK